MPTEEYITIWILKHIDNLRERNHDNGIDTDTVTGIVYCRRIEQVCATPLCSQRV
jgi:hypothetical protein